MNVLTIFLNTTPLIPSIATIMKPQYADKVGDRVAERPKSHGIVTARNKVRKEIAKYRSQRYGTVVELTKKPDKLGRNHNFLVIKWDHLKSPTEHAQMRICPIEELDKLQSNGYGTEV